MRNVDPAPVTSDDRCRDQLPPDGALRPVEGGGGPQSGPPAALPAGHSLQVGTLMTRRQSDPGGLFTVRCPLTFFLFFCKVSFRFYLISTELIDGQLLHLYASN